MFVDTTYNIRSPWCSRWLSELQWSCYILRTGTSHDSQPSFSVCGYIYMYWLAVCINNYVNIIIRMATPICLHTWLIIKFCGLYVVVCVCVCVSSYSYRLSDWILLDSNWIKVLACVWYWHGEWATQNDHTIEIVYPSIVVHVPNLLSSCSGELTWLNLYCTLIRNYIDIYILHRSTSLCILSYKERRSIKDIRVYTHNCCRK